MTEQTQTMSLADLQAQIAALQEAATEARKAETVEKRAQKAAAEKEDREMLRTLIKEMRAFDLADAKAEKLAQKAEKKAEAEKSRVEADAAKQTAVTAVISLVEDAMKRFRMTRKQVVEMLSAEVVTE